jgi:hypothetical protein
MSDTTNQTTDSTTMQQDEEITTFKQTLPNNGIDLSKFVISGIIKKSEPPIIVDSMTELTTNPEQEKIHTTGYIVATSEDSSDNKDQNGVDTNVFEFTPKVHNSFDVVIPSDTNIENNDDVGSSKTIEVTFEENQNPYVNATEAMDTVVSNFGIKLDDDSTLEAKASIEVTNGDSEVNILPFDTLKTTITKLYNEQQNSIESSLDKIEVTHPKKKKKNKSNAKPPEKMVERDVSSLIAKFDNGKSNKPKQQAVLLVPANRQATSYLRQALSSPTGLEGEDGVNFINVSYAANTRLGSFLDINAHTPFEHPEIGNFESVGGVWYYIKSQVPDEAFRHVWGDRVRNMGKRIIAREVIGFRTIIADATWVKIVSNPEAMNDMADTTVPFKSFYYYGPLNLKKSIQDTGWYLVALEEIRRTLKLRSSTGNFELQPDFTNIESNYNNR